MKKIIYAYRLTIDSGFAPCIDDKILSLACCKGGRILHKGIDDEKVVCTGLRHTIGTDHKNLLGKSEEEVFLLGIYKNKLLYFAKIDEILTMKEYFSDPKYKKRKDQIYVVDKNYKLHNKNGKETNDDKRTFAGEYVLISKHFIYFGKSCGEIDELLEVLPKFQENKHYGKTENDDIAQKLYDFAVGRGFDETKALVMGKPNDQQEEHSGEKSSKGGCSKCG